MKNRVLNVSHGLLKRSPIVWGIFAVLFISVVGFTLIPFTMLIEALQATKKHIVDCGNILKENLIELKGFYSSAYLSIRETIKINKNSPARIKAIYELKSRQLEKFPTRPYTRQRIILFLLNKPEELDQMLTDFHENKQTKLLPPIAEWVEIDDGLLLVWKKSDSEYRLIAKSVEDHE